ncbi:MAG TPA: hypothetical protein VER55_15005 [Ardenticatenaceae bacterium]|nr:hypothetical protein [Ardenticatenaceae bacterium]
MKIVELCLQTQNLDAQREFYSDVLQLRLLEATGREWRFRPGAGGSNSSKH